MGLGEKYKTGLLWQDTQHKQLIELMEKLSESNTKQSDSQIFVYTTAFLVMYVTHHFTLEEQYMEAYGYPDLEFHVEEHKKYIAIVKKFRKEHTQYSLEGALFLEENIRKWILKHIMDNDQKLGEFIQEQEKMRILDQIKK